MRIVEDCCFTTTDSVVPKMAYLHILTVLVLVTVGASVRAAPAVDDKKDVPDVQKMMSSLQVQYFLPIFISLISLILIPFEGKNFMAFVYFCTM